MTVFQELLAVAAETIDAVNGETFTVMPRALPVPAPGGFVDVNARRTVHSTRQPFNFTGNFTAASEEFNAMGRQRAQNTTRASNAPSPMIDAKNDGWPYMPQPGDTVLRVATGQRFTVASELPVDDIGRTTLYLAVQQGQAA